ncbi:enoyl-CoA hydratase/carnithine racemase [Caulobacter ginsengisoli]|uniref:Enoyl-CoA hydratase/carnithine racemase n=1 Tax=Caulobacter ginsengisoli TaxID=400775 RepID=A0ABU0IXU1_9CAUL|nr:enoyl-CoA hydratase-related protein [Caulobacter ginsengisoli]MDQ0465869.1 enoyl-CoA hydratase/carnithine racemase [Caulobacter ginsengisoli]
MTTETLLTDLADGVLTVTLNRPDRMNAYTAQMGVELAEAFQQADEDDAVRVVIVTGHGRAFCAGADVSDGADSFGGGGAKLFGTRTSETRRLKGGFTEAIFTCRKPSIAAINGGAVGVGITMTLPMDIRIASSTAKLGFVFARRGLTPEAGAAWFLPRLVGISQALRWCYSGKVFDAAEALRGGLVSEVTEPQDLLARAREIAREIVEETSPVSIALTRQLLWRFAGESDPLAVLAVDGPINLTLGSTPDVREGVAAFLEKRRPNFASKVSTDMPPQYPWWDRS